MEIARIAYDILSPEEEFVREAVPVLAVAGAIVCAVFIASIIVILVLLKKKRGSSAGAAVETGDAKDLGSGPEDGK